MNENINKWKADFADWVDADTLNDGERCYIEARKKAQEDEDENLVIFLNECGFDNSGCYDIEEVKRNFKHFMENEVICGIEIATEKRDKLLGIYSRMVAKYKSYLSEDDDEIIHEANKELQELK